MVTELIEIGEARRLVTERLAPLPVEDVPLQRALGRVLRAEVRSAEPVPGFTNSAMDGFAVRAADTAAADGGSPATLRIVDESRAGHPATAALREGEAIQISTGAAVPRGADAVVRVEDTDSSDARVEVRAAARPGQNVREAGEDMRADEAVLAAGTPLGPAELGVLASVDRAVAPCARQPRTAILTTGDELLAPGEDSRPGGVRNSNLYAIAGLAERAGAEVAETATVRDDPGETRTALARALDGDLAIVCGGVSVGEHDHVRPALAELGVEEVFWGVALRPGKPTWFGVAGDGTPVFGLPGNPVSAIVTFLLFVRPAIGALLGVERAAERTTAILSTEYRKPPGRAHAVRCRIALREDGWHVAPTKEQGSHILTSMLGAGALAIVPTDAEVVPAGERVEIEMLPGAWERWR